MPILDKERGVLVVRVIYDGPPMSGKTTTLRALAQRLGVQISSPQEKDGRTLFFDWVDYVGGLFEGRQIRCQILSVPGQKELGKRRRHLLESADAIVMVADTREGEVEAAYALLGETLPWCRSQDPPIGVVIQANKRDAPNSVPRARIHEEFEQIAPLAIVDTVATNGEGVREAFVFAVRLALDRVRSLATTRRLREGGPEADDADELMRQMAPISVAPLALAASAEEGNGVLEGKSEENRPGAEAKTPVPESGVVASARAFIESSSGAALDPRGGAAVEADSGASKPDASVMDTAEPHDTVVTDLAPESDGLTAAVVGREQGSERIFVPDPMMPGGFIWPPVDGRTFLHEVARLERTPVRTPSGDWWASGEGWRFHSAADSLYGSADLGRQELIEWARLHAANLHRLSAGRTVILADAGGGRFRLWQLVRVSQALREKLVNSVADAEPSELARELQNAAFHLVRARRAFNGSDICLPCTLWTVSGDMQRHPIFVGLMPTPGDERIEEESDSKLLEREFRPLLHSLETERSDYPEILNALARVQTAHNGGLAEKLFRMASGEVARYSAQ